MAITRGFSALKACTSAASSSAGEPIDAPQRTRGAMSPSGVPNVPLPAAVPGASLQKVCATTGTTWLTAAAESPARQARRERCVEITRVCRRIGQRYDRTD